MAGSYAQSGVLKGGLSENLFVTCRGEEGGGGKSYGAAMSITALLSVHLYYVCTTVSMYVNLL